MNNRSKRCSRLGGLVTRHKQQNWKSHCGKGGKQESSLQAAGLVDTSPQAMDKAAKELAALRHSNKGSKRESHRTTNQKLLEALAILDQSTTPNHDSLKTSRQRRSQEQDKQNQQTSSQQNSECRISSSS